MVSTTANRDLGLKTLDKPLRKAVLPVAGLGTRFLPATKAMAKEMLPVVDKPLIQYAIEEARAAGIEQFCLVTGRGKTAIVEHFDIAFELEATLRERDKADALALLKTTSRAGVDGDGAPAGPARARPRDLVRPRLHRRRTVRHPAAGRSDAVRHPVPAAARRSLRETGGNVVAVTEVPREHTQRYGILRVGRDAGRLVEVTGLVEKPAPEEAPSNLSIIGRYVLMPEVIDHLARMERGAGDEVQLTDAMAKLIGDAAVPRRALRGTAVRLRRQGGVPRGADRLRAEATRSRRRRAWLPETIA